MKMILITLFAFVYCHGVEINVGIDDNCYTDGKSVGWINNRFLRVNDNGITMEYYNDGKVQTQSITPLEDDIKRVVTYIERIKDDKAPKEMLENYIRLQVHIEAYGRSIHGIFFISDIETLPMLLRDPKLNGVAKVRNGLTSH